MSLPRSSVVVFRAALVIALVAVTYLATTDRSYPIAEGLNDKLSHVLAFGALAFLGDFAFPAGKFDLKKFIPLLSYGLLIEFIQYFLPYREASLFDVMADCIGLGIYWTSYRYLRYVPVLRLRWVAFAQTRNANVNVDNGILRR